MAAEPSGAAGLTVKLPQLEEFLRVPLPEMRPERYASFRETSRIHVGQSHLHQVDLISEESLLLALSDAEATVRVYDRSTKRLVGNHAVPGYHTFETGGVLAWPEGEPRFVVGTTQGTLLVDARTGALLDTLDDRPVRGLRWSPDRRILVAQRAAESSHASTLYLFGRAAGLEPLGDMHFAERVDAWDLSRDNRLLAVSYYPSGDLHVIDLHEGSDVLRVPGPRYAGDVAFSPDGRLVAVGGEGLLLVDLVNPQRRAFYSHFFNNVGHVRFSPSGDALAASSYDGHIRIFRHGVGAGAAGTPLTLLPVQTLRHAGQANVYAFVFEAAGDGLVSVSGDQTIRTFRATTQRALGPAANPPAPPARTFLSLAEWKEREPAAVQALTPLRPALADGHYVPPSLLGLAKPSRVRARALCLQNRLDVQTPRLLGAQGP